MAIREIRKYDDPALYKVCRPVEKFDERLGELLDDMAETMYQANGVGRLRPRWAFCAGWSLLMWATASSSW